MDKVGIGGVAGRRSVLERDRDRLRDGIIDSLDLLIGHVRVSPGRKAATMTFKADGKTVTRGLGGGIADRARVMTANHKRVIDLVRELSAVNWELLEMDKVKK